MNRFAACAILCLLPLPAMGAAKTAPKPDAGVTLVPAQQLVPEILKPPGDIALKTYFSTPGYSATLVRRTRPGAAEVHRAMTDVWYVIEGAGTLITNGTLAGEHETEPGEPRGAAIAGGTSRHIATGDLIAIPAGIPHWVSAIEGGRIVYLVVKVRTPASR